MKNYIDNTNLVFLNNKFRFAKAFSGPAVMLRAMPTKCSEN